MTAIDDLPPLREAIRRHGLSAKKSLGQNFLLDLNLTARIARAGGPLDGVTVVEIGPGPGGLTRALIAEGARRVVAIERDSRAIAALGEIAAHYPGRLTVVEGDALEIEWHCSPSPQSKSAAADFDPLIEWPKPAYTRFRLGEGRGGGSGGDGTCVPHCTTPIPDPSPQGGGEKKRGRTSRFDRVGNGEDAIAHATLRRSRRCKAPIKAFAF